MKGTFTSVSFFYKSSLAAPSGDAVGFITN